MSSSQRVDSQSTTDDETCSDGGSLSELRKDVERLFQHQQTLMDNQQQILHMLQQQQSMNETCSDSLGRRIFLSAIYFWITVSYTAPSYHIEFVPVSKN